MRRIVLLVTLGASCPWTAAALDGVVVDVSGHPVAGARVTVAATRATAVADASGRFTLSPDPEPPFVLLVARPDGVAYRPVTVVRTPAAGPLRVVVKPLGGTVTVVSGAPPDLEIPPAAAATVLGREELAAADPATLAEAVTAVPGATLSGVGPSAVPALRGLPKGRTLLVLDGARITAERRAGPSATFLDPLTVEEIEVVRGPGSVAYGSDAFGGVIRARSRMPPPGRPWRADWTVGAATATGERTAALEVTFPGLGGALLLGGHVRSFDDIETPAGTVRPSAARLGGGRLAYQRALGRGTLRLGWRTDLGRDIGKPKPDPAKRYVYPEEDSHRLSLEWEGRGPGRWSRVAASAAWGSYRLVLDRDRLGPGGLPRRRERADTDARDWEVRVEGERPVGRARLVAGLDAYGRYGLRATTSSWTREGERLVLERRTAAIADAAATDVGLFGGLSGQWGRVRLDTGLRLDGIRAVNRGGLAGGRTVEHAAASGFASAEVAPGRGLRAALQVASGFRDARLSDRFYTGPTGRGFIHGNPDLDPERSRQLDLAIRLRRHRLQLDAYAYLYRIEDLIERYREGGEYFFRNRGEAQLRGLELEARLDLGRGLALRLGALAERGEVRGPGDPVDDVPPATLLATLAGVRGPVRWQVRVRAVDRKGRPGPSEREVPGHVTVDLSAAWRVAPALEVRVVARNLFDRAYHPTWDEDAILAPGRTVAVYLRGTAGAGR